VIPLIKQSCDFEFPLGAEIDSNIAKLFSGAKTTQLFLSLFSFIYCGDESKSKLSKQVTKSLSKLFHKILMDATQFSTLTVEKQHRTRKRIKQLRYCIDFISRLYPEKEVQQFLNKLEPIQEYLGFYNDLFVAEQIFENRR
jgi:CHAD domain-containing protein